MTTKPLSNSLIRHPSAYIPIAMSVAALLLLLGHIAIYGVVRQADEGRGPSLPTPHGLPGADRSRSLRSSGCRARHWRRSRCWAYNW